MVEFFGFWIGLAIAVALAVLAVKTVRRAAEPPTYRRSEPYTKAGRREFKVHGIANMEDIEAFAAFIVRRYRVTVLEKDWDPDDFVVTIGKGRNKINLLYADHLGARVQSYTRKESKLFRQLLDDLGT